MALCTTLSALGVSPCCTGRMPENYGSKPYTPKQLDHSSGHAFLSSAGDIFYSPNCSRKVEVPVPSDDYPFRIREANFETFLSPRWWKKPYHYLSFVTMRPSFEGIVFGYLRDIVPYVEQVEDSRFALAPQKVGQWVRVEDALITMSHLLSQSYGRVRASLNPIPPSLLGFAKSFFTSRSARLRIAASRDWFLIWMALISSKIADIETRVEVDLRGDWFTVLVGHDVPQDWLSAVQSSIVCDFSQQCPRVGTFLDILNPEPDQPRVEWFYSWNIPVWYCCQWGRGHPKLEYLQPPPHVLQVATTFISKMPTSLPSTSSHSSSLPLTSPPTSPPHKSLEYSPDEYKHAQDAYLATKPWLAYFEDRNERNKRRMADESPEERITRLNRERKRPVVSATVFLWEWSDGPTIELVRRRVAREEREDVLGFHSDSQCVYDSVSNYWDVCEYFGDDDFDDDDEEQEEEVDGGFYDNDDYGYLDNEPTADPQAIHQKLIDERVRQNINSPRHVMEVARTHDLGPEVDLTHAVNEFNLLQYMTLFYGFVHPLPVPEKNPTPINQHEWDECLKSVGLRIGTHSPPLPGLAGPIINFIKGLQGRGPKEFEWDLFPTNRQYLAKNVVQGFRKLSESLYLLDHAILKEKSTGWKIAVTTSVNALHVLRYIIQTPDVPSSAALAQHLAEEGIPFRTFLTLDPLASTISLDAIKTKIPRRVANYEFKPADYGSYVANRRRLLATPRGRAAILQGGIVGRLAKEHLGVESVGFGPSSAVTTHRLGYSVEVSEATYWDDGLTNDEIAVICGLHSCFTGNGDQTALMSWWPLPHYWDNKNNGYNWGHWTEWDEAWYQERLNAIQNGKAENSLPLPQVKWRDYLRGSGTWRNVTKCILAKSNEQF